MNDADQRGAGATGLATLAADGAVLDTFFPTRSPVPRRAAAPPARAWRRPSEPTVRGVRSPVVRP